MGRAPACGPALRKLSAQWGALAPTVPKRTSTWDRRDRNQHPPMLSHYGGVGFPGEEHQLGKSASVNPQGTAVRGSELPALLVGISSSFLKGALSGTPPWLPRQVLAPYPSAGVVTF